MGERVGPIRRFLGLALACGLLLALALTWRSIARAGDAGADEARAAQAAATQASEQAREAQKLASWQQTVSDAAAADLAAAQRAVTDAQAHALRERDRAGALQQQANDAARRAQNLQALAQQRAVEVQQAAAAAPPQTALGSGTLGAVDAEKITLSRDGAAPLVLQLAPTTRVTLDGVAVQPIELPRGAEVRAAYVAGAEPQVAVRIDAVSKP